MAAPQEAEGHHSMYANSLHIKARGTASTDS